MLAYSYQQNVLPIFTELKTKTLEEYEKVSKRALPLTGSIYFAVGVICSLSFAPHIESSILLNIGDARHKDDPNKGFWEAYICQITFMMVLMCHIPFIYFTGKQAMLTVFDEVMRKSISNALWHKLQANAHFSSQVGEEPPNPTLPIPAGPGNSNMDDNRMSFNDIVVKQSEVDNGDRNSAIKTSRIKSAAMMSHVSAAVAQQIAVSDMNIGVYVGITVGFYALIVLLAMLIEDISSIFDFVSAYSISSLAFFIPGMFYRKAVHKFNADMNDANV